ncbi:3-hydroxyacyl-CoA dehydrogenase NAD-binding domain-containing protein [Aestuariivirga sp.]|uniref:3-hydroxyacyl-CoA dehydrogenase NAD-binding domain-containing protein n=1 Tax=Aestuariivirga sp. TaxID=2650926 RepID=UPI0035931A2B
MARPLPQDVKHVVSIGGGPIGAGWAAHFLARGYDVTGYLHAMPEEAVYRKILDTAWLSLEQLGLAEGASRERLRLTDNLEDAVRTADFVQESAPERLDLKQALYAKLGTLVPEGVVISSSTSGFMMTDIQMLCPTPERTVIGHPFNPPYLLPLVEIIGGKKTSPDAVEWARDFYAHAGKAPLVMKKEIPGFVATRLQEAIWREALHMVANGEATPEDIDIALMNGPAPRLAIQGQCMAFHVACGEGGMATNLDQFGPALKLPWTRLQAPELTKELRDRMVDGCDAIAAGRHFEEMAAERDRAIVGILKAVKAARAGGV